MRLGDLDALLESAGIFEAKVAARGCGKSILSLAKAWLWNEVNKAPTIDAVPVVQTPCDFCSKWDWGEAAAVVDNGKYAHIHLAGGSYRFPADKQFNCCPVCGYPNPYKERKDGEG